MQLKEVMTRNVEVIGPEATLEDAASRMDALDIGPLPVCENDRLVGIITDRDITVRSTAMGDDPKATHVRDAMSKDVLYCREDDDVRDATRLMEAKQVRRIAEPSDLQLVLEFWRGHVAGFVKRHQDRRCILSGRSLHFNRGKTEEQL